MADIPRIETLWTEARGRFGGDGPFLFGAAFTAADVMFAPVVARFLTWQSALTPGSLAYCATVRGHPLVSEGYDAAAREPDAWRLEEYETAR